jgi:hypothetical protein
MPTTTTYPNGQSLVSSALTQQEINILLQQLTCGMLGIRPVDPMQVRVDWQAEGQPDIPRPSVDVCYISCVTQDSDYAKIARDRTFTGTEVLTENWNYTRSWLINWDLYGPNSTDRTRQIHSATFMDYFSDVLSLSNLYLLSDPPAPTRIPVEHNNQWYEHSHFHCDFYEAVTETIQDSIATSVEIKLETNDGLAADFTVTKP